MWATLQPPDTFPFLPTFESDPVNLGKMIYAAAATDARFSIDPEYMGALVLVLPR